MQLQELMEHLSSELRLRNIGNIDQEGLGPDNIDEIIPFINLGLMVLYTRFPIKTNHVKVRLYDDYTFYKLHPKFAQSNEESTEEYKFIEDNADQRPFFDRVLKIDQVFGGNGCELPLNKENRKDSIFVPYPDTIQVPCPTGGDLIHVLYRAAPKKITKDTPNSTDIDLPYVYLNALLNFVVAKIIGRRDKLDSFQEAQGLMGVFERECLVLEKQGVIHKASDFGNKLEQKGFI